MDWASFRERMVSGEKSLKIFDNKKTSFLLFKTGNVSMKSTRGFETPLYFEMPPQFTGDRLLSYGGVFTFTIEMMECETGLDQITVQQFPLIRIMAHDSLSIDYFGVWFLSLNKEIFYFFQFNFFFFTSSPNHFTQVRMLRKRYEWRNCIGDCMPAVKPFQGEFSWPLCRISRTFLSVARHRLHLPVSR